MLSLLKLVDTVISLYIWIVIIQVVLSWLVAANVINTQSRFVYAIGTALYRLTEPVYQPLRRIIPRLGGLDLTPAVVILAAIFIRDLLSEMATKYFQ